MDYYRGFPRNICDFYIRWIEKTPLLDMWDMFDCSSIATGSRPNPKVTSDKLMNYLIYELDDFDWFGNMLKSAPLSPYPSYKFFKYHTCEYTMYHYIKPLSSVLPWYIKYFMKVTYDIEISYLNSKIMKNLNDVFGEKYFERGYNNDYFYEYRIQCLISDSAFPLTNNTELFKLVVRRLKQKFEFSHSIIIFYHDTKAHQETRKLEDIEYCKQLKRKRGK